MSNNQRDVLPTRVLLGTAVGDALGLKGEGLPRSAARKLQWGDGPFFGRAILTDDTEQSFLVAQSLIRAAGDVDQFARLLRWRLIGWLFAGPPGVGLGTARSIMKLAFGFRTGVRTAGNGAAMRSAIIGAAYPADPDRVERFVRASCRLTHNDPRALVGALAVALAAGAHVRGESLRDVVERVAPLVDEAPDAARWRASMTTVIEAVGRSDSVPELAEVIGCETGVSGYVYDTVPVALFAWARHDDPERALEEIWACGGDTDTVGAIAGALLYAKSHRAPPSKWLERIVDFPLTTARLEEAGAAVASNAGPVRWAWWLMPVRNLCMFPLILFYAFFVMMPRKLRS